MAKLLLEVILGQALRRNILSVSEFLVLIEGVEWIISALRIRLMLGLRSRFIALPVSISHPCSRFVVFLEAVFVPPLDIALWERRLRLL